MTDIPDAAVEATATHLFLVDRRLKGLTPIAWKLATEFERTYFRAEAVLALDAAMPAIREAIAQDIERQRVPYTLQETAGRCWALGQQDAARLVRETP